MTSNVSSSMLIGHQPFLETNFIQDLLKNLTSSDLSTLINTVYGVTTTNNLTTLCGQIISSFNAQTNQYMPKMNTAPSSQLYGHFGAYKKSGGVIFISDKIITESINKPKRCLIFAAMLIEEYGHHLEKIIQDELSLQDTDTHGDEGAVFGFQLLHMLNQKLVNGSLNDIELEIFRLEKADSSTLVSRNLLLSDIIYSRFEHFSSSHQSHDHKHGELEFFGSGLGHVNTCTHYTMERDAIQRTWNGIRHLRDKFIEDPSINLTGKFLGGAYKGNWARDMSQIIDAKPLDITGLTRDTLTKLVALIGRQEFISLSKNSGGWMDSDALNRETRGQWSSFVTQEQLGVYLPWEHLDNPKLYSSDQNGVPYLDTQGEFDPDLKDLNYHPLDTNQYLFYEHKIDDKTRMKSYLSKTGTQMHDEIQQGYQKSINWFKGKSRGSGTNKANWMSATDYVLNRLNSAYNPGQDLKGKVVEDVLFDLGSAMHVIEDFYAHSNFIEIMLIRIGERLALCNDPCNVTDCFCTQFRNVDGSWLVQDLPNMLKKVDPWVPSPHRNDTECSIPNCTQTNHVSCASWASLQGQSKSADDYIPLTTGTFTEFDIVASLSDKIVQMLEPGAREEKINKSSRKSILEDDFEWILTPKHEALSILLKDKNLPSIILDEIIAFLFNTLDDAQKSTVLNSVGTNLTGWQDIDTDQDKFVVLEQSYAQHFGSYDPSNCITCGGQCSNCVIRASINIAIPFINSVKGINFWDFDKSDVFEFYQNFCHNDGTWINNYNKLKRKVKTQIVEVQQIYEQYLGYREAVSKFKTSTTYSVIKELVGLDYVQLRDFLWISESISNLIMIVEHAIAQNAAIVNRLFARVIRNEVDVIQGTLGALSIEESTDNLAIDYDNLPVEVQQVLSTLNLNASAKKYIAKANNALSEIPQFIRDNLPSSIDWNVASTDPTHSMLAKDCPDHPLHILAAEMGTIASSAFFTDFLLHTVPDSNTSPSNQPDGPEYTRLVKRIIRHPDFFFTSDENSEDSASNSNLAIDTHLTTATDFSINSDSTWTAHIATKDSNNAGLRKIKNWDNFENRLIESAMTSNLIDAVIRFIGGSSSLIPHSLGNNVRNALTVLGRPRFGLIPQIQSFVANTSDEFKFSNIISDWHDALTDFSLTKFKDYSSYASMFVHGLSAADTLTQAYHDINATTDDIVSVYNRFYQYLKDEDGNLAVEFSPKIAIEKRDASELLKFSDKYCLLKAQIEFMKETYNFFENIVDSAKIPKGPALIIQLGVHFGNFYYKTEEINEEGNKLWNLYMKEFRNDFLVCPSKDCDHSKNCSSNTGPCPSNCNNCQPQASTECRSKKVITMSEIISDPSKIFDYIFDEACGTVLSHDATLKYDNTCTTDKTLSAAGQDIACLAVGWKVRGNGIDDGTTISNISNNMITLSQSHHFENDNERKLEFYHKDIIIDISQGW